MIPHGKFNPQQASQGATQQQNVRVNLADAEDIVCEECGSKVFTMVFLLKKISALLSPTGKEENVPVQTIACHKCGHVNKQFLPE